MAREFTIIEFQNETFLCYKEDHDYVDISNPMVYFTEKEDEFKIIPIDPSYQTKIYNYQGTEVLIEPEIYENGWPAVLVRNLKDPDDYIILTTNLIEERAFGLPPRNFIDCNNQPEAMEFLIKNGLAKDLKYYKTSGFVRYPMVWLNIPLLYQHKPQVYNDYFRQELGIDKPQISKNKKISDNIDNHISKQNPTQVNKKTKGKKL